MRSLALLFSTSTLLTSVQAFTNDQSPFSLYYNATPILTIPSDRWGALNESVGGRLLPGVPFARPCYAKYKDSVSGIEEEECAQVRSSYRNELMRTSVAAAQINTQWETCQARSEACLLDFADPFDPEAAMPPNECYQGSVSNYYIDVRTPGDIQAALAFSRTTAIPLVIRNTGHDYKGRSSAPNSLALWMHNLKEMSYHAAFTPTCPQNDNGPSDEAFVPKEAVTLGAGVQWFEAYAFAEQYNITLVGGADRTVGTTGGWLQGGGHGALSNMLGMGADRVFQFVAVTPDGVVRVANHCQNQDLFFALRGGGGGTFAVVLSATTRADPRVTIQGVLIQYPPQLHIKGGFESEDNQGDLGRDGHKPEESLALTRSFWSLLIKHALRWAHEGWGGYVNANSALYLNPVLGKEESQESMRELVEWGQRLKASAGELGTGVVVLQGEYDSWGDFFNTFADANSADLGQPLALASRLIPVSSFTTAETRAELVDALIAAERDTPGVRLLKTTPFNYPNSSTFSYDTGSRPNSDTATNPAWRSSVFHVTAIAPWNWNATLTEVRGRYDTVSRAMEHVRKVTGGDKGAAYVNEADVYEGDHEDIFWGEHYPRLLEIKNKYDPDRLLDCWHCVGWKSDSPRFSCYL